MLPITVGLAHVPVILIGSGPRTLRRLSLLDEAGARHLQVFAPAAEDKLVQRAGARLRRRWPKPEEIAAARLLFIADRLGSGVEREILALARGAGSLVNVEDEPALSDFHSAALLRRGDLTVAVSTGGRSPALARRLRDLIADTLGPEWRQVLEEAARLRAHWRQGGADPMAVGTWTEAWLARRRRLTAEPPPGSPCAVRPAEKLKQAAPSGAACSS